MYINNYVPLFWYSDEATLNSLARERGFAVQDVPGDGDCLFSAVGVQLENIGIQSGRRNLRAELVEHLQSSPYTHGSSHLRNYVSGWCKTWTVDSGLDSWTGLWTEIWTLFWTDAQGDDDHFQETMDRRYGTTTVS